MMNSKSVIGFIGTGVMGCSMAGHLIKAGYPLLVFNRTRAKARTLEEQGATWCGSVAEIAARAEVIVSIVGYPEDVAAVYLGTSGVVAKARPGSLLMDMTTSSPELAIKIHEEAGRKDIPALDAPVSGGDVGAREARLSIMVGGDKEAFDQAEPLFQIMGRNIVYQGPAGAGQHTKMCNQIAIASGMVAICEAMAYAQKSGLNPETVLQSIESGAAASWSLSNLAPRMLQGNFAPGFYVKHFLKDMRIAIESAESMQLDLPGLKQAKKLYDRLAEQGGAELGTQALYKLFVTTS